MFRKLGMRMDRRDPEETPASVLGFKDTKLTRTLGLEILRDTPGRRNHVQGIRECLTSMTREEKDDLVDRVLGRLALFVFDLPASEKNHHARRFGLLDHLLDVAYLTARELSGPGFEISPEPAIHHREGPLWVYAGMIAAIAHDLGKPLDLDVVAPGTSESWDPRREPLRVYCERNGLGATAPELWHFHAGRGMHSHERHIETLLPMVMIPEVGKFLGPRLASILRALSSQEDWSATGGASESAHEVIKIMRRMDQHSSINDLGPRAQSVNRAGAPPAPMPLPLPAPSGVGKLPQESPAGEAPLGHDAWPDPDPRGQLPLFVPFGYWGESVPKQSSRRGDPVENERKLAAQLDPAKFLDLVRRMIVGRRLDRNGIYSDVYLRPDYVWLVLPAALRRTALINHLPFDTRVMERMFSSFRASPHVEPCDLISVPLFIRTRPDSAAFKAIRIKTLGFLSEAELGTLGFHPFEIKVMPTPVLEQAGR